MNPDFYPGSGNEKCIYLPLCNYSGCNAIHLVLPCMNRNIFMKLKAAGTLKRRMCFCAISLFREPGHMVRKTGPYCYSYCPGVWLKV